ncbi:hypothetical protein SK128_001261 [Halocaridina rubra]|uniref:Uncharacterized protein n=1 Tax=Halocaridina rubra TaxID=373956 RepID=A0AAN8X4F6_HALRR
MRSPHLLLPISPAEYGRHPQLHLVTTTSSFPLTFSPITLYCVVYYSHLNLYLLFLLICLQNVTIANQVSVILLPYTKSPLKSWQGKIKVQSHVTCLLMGKILINRYKFKAPRIYVTLKLLQKKYTGSDVAFERFINNV